MLSKSCKRSKATFCYNERGFRPRDVVSLCSLAVSTKSGSEFLGTKAGKGSEIGELSGVSHEFQAFELGFGSFLSVVAAL